MGSHGKYGEDGLFIPADKAIGRKDYGRPQCPHNTRNSLCNFLRMPIFQRRPRKFRARRGKQGQAIKGTPHFNVKMDTTFTNDIALVRLSQPVEYTQWVSPVRLPRVNAPRKYTGYTAYVSGWGVRGPGEGPSQILKGAELTVNKFYTKKNIEIFLHIFLRLMTQSTQYYNQSILHADCEWSANKGLQKANRVG